MSGAEGLSDGAASASEAEACTVYPAHMTSPKPKKPAKKAPPKKRMGRPPKKPSERRSTRVVVRFTPVELRAIEAAASTAGDPVATWIARVAFLACQNSA